MSSSLSQPTESMKSRLAHAATSDPKIRYDLCEILSDVLLTDPTVAMRKDCPNRLWRGCFYQRINELRLRVSKERAKLKKKSSNNENNTNNLKELEKTLQVFLREAVVLYDYLIKKYEEKIVPATQDSQLSPPRGGASQQQQQQQPGDLNSLPAGVIPNLFRLLIHLGDLHRYADSLARAEASYELASKLAPGKGNPYNQLAVVAQLKDAQSPLTCVALYWYSRSLLALQEPFETSKPNLCRLFGTNKNCLRDITTSAPMMDGKKSLSQEGRNSKSASKQFLFTFVDLHRQFFFGLVPDDTEPKKEQAKLTETQQSMSCILENLPVLLGTAFSDSLLFKLVTISAFSVVSGGNNNNIEEPAEHLHLTGCVSRGFMLKLGARVAERVELGLKKVVNKAKQDGAMSSVRYLLPLLLLMEFILAPPFQMEELPVQESDFFQEAVQEFLEQTSSLANVVVENAEVLGVDKNKKNHVEFKEFQAFRGYAPFSSFVRNVVSERSEGPPAKRSRDEIAGGFIGAHEAASVLDQIHSSTQDSANGSNAQETRLKLSRLLSFMDILDSVALFPSLVRIGSDGFYQVGKLQEDSNDVQMAVAEDSPPAMAVISSNNSVAEKVATDEEAGDMVVYRAPLNGDGPSLLVPSMLLVGAGSEKGTTPPPPPLPPPPRPKPVEQLNIGVRAMDIDSGPTPKPGIKPPPGFGPPAPPLVSSILGGLSPPRPSPPTELPSFQFPTDLLGLKTTATTNNPFLNVGGGPPGLFGHSTLFAEQRPDWYDSLFSDGMQQQQQQAATESQPLTNNPFI
eukprot:CAMPEP_0118708344 /NCGR_PEP_ID=MMETSP0800-20121206/21818_1 /TAXON_ID=210618 ORGANISM="Striatella unipunctata, Strain CCMP2910" /NCGR_SAMPLE_ID=MMETSP0800 /ASSEMBLY_ACC=CAM_ASM_000638 /LENGTH=795 /DNA_ID=CAMNT_0006611493 /DNA_START=96 /DNA_END=2483 /DNA_ORIENTATION=+